MHSVADAKLTQMEESFETRIAQARAEASHKVETIRRELEQLRRAASGDSCGWEENKNGTFSNIETGETGVTTIPEALAFARAVQRIDDLGNQEETAKMSQKLAKQSETKRRELDIKLNEARADARAQREILANWVSTAKTIEASFSSHLSCLNSTCGALNLKDAFLAQKNNVLRRSLFRVNHAVASLKELRDALKLAEASKAGLESRVHQLQVSFKDTQQELDSLRNSLTSAVETEVKPIRLEICKARDALSRERLARMVERRQFAALWPSGHLAPMALRLHVDASGSKRQILLNAACIAAADAEIKREIRRRVADASRWSQKADDYGRKYFVHSDSGEAAWEPPSAMLFCLCQKLNNDCATKCHACRYEPPPGRDELGNSVSVDPSTGMQPKVSSAVSESIEGNNATMRTSVHLQSIRARTSILVGKRLSKDISYHYGRKWRMNGAKHRGKTNQPGMLPGLSHPN